MRACEYCEWRNTKGVEDFVQGADHRCTACGAKLLEHANAHPHQRWRTKTTGDGWSRVCNGYQYADLDQIHLEALSIEASLR